MAFVYPWVFSLQTSVKRLTKKVNSTIYCQLVRPVSLYKMIIIFLTDILRMFVRIFLEQVPCLRTINPLPYNSWF